jgi:lipopolysaccharide biosynthesis glycosyltransferase
MNKERIVLASAIDDNYAQHLGAMFVSIFENKGEEEIVYYVIDGGISEKNIKRLKKISKKYNFELIF